MQFVENPNLSNVDNSVCTIIDLPATVGEFIAEATALGGWGVIDVYTTAQTYPIGGNYRGQLIIGVEYKHGQHGNPAPEIAALPVLTARSVGSWGRTDYTIYV